MEGILSYLFAAIIGAIVAEIFDPFLKSIRSRLLKWIKTIFYITFGPRRPIPKPETLSLGKLRTQWLVIDGDGDMTYTPETITCQVEDTPVTLPPEIEQLRNEIEEREELKRKQGLNCLWNGPLYSLVRCPISRTVPEERMEVIFTFRPTDYYTFQATVMSLDRPLMKPPAEFSFRHKYLRDHDISKPIPFLANGFGVVLVLITKDRKLILARRDPASGARAGELDVSVVEGVHPISDRSSVHRGPDLYRTAIRGAKEEIGVDLTQSEITFLGFGVDVEYYQWNMVGMARLSETANQVLESRSRGTAGKWELKKLEMVDFDPRAVFSYLRGEKLWSTGWAAIYWTLVHEYGKRHIDSVVKEVFG